MAEVPTETAESPAISKVHKNGFGLVSPTIVYAFMQ
ncbi:MAG: hypothetical protein CL608_30930 [Anaerolineaceae bacterium]|nr:hypothetical protein [Anaerolineaceae bacterium]